MKATLLKNVKLGGFFRFSENGRTFVRSDYDRSTKKFEYYDYDDVCRWNQAKGNRIVLVDFEF